jgi:hypothetical protein
MAEVNPVSAITRALSPAQQVTIVRRFTQLNPHWRGAGVADILDILYQSDSDLETTEPFFEANPDIIGPGAGVAARALIWSTMPLTVSGMMDLLARAGLRGEADAG